MTRPISRRTVLRGLGTAMALPWLEAMSAPLRAAAPAEAPRRLAFLYVPNGVHMPAWTPTAEGADFELPSILAPLAPYREHLSVLTGLAQRTAYALGDGPGDHARSLACFLTGVHPNKTDGSDIRAGVSVDQVAAQKIGKATRFPSLELGIEAGRQAGNCDSGYSCAYSSNISWRTPTTPVPKEINPRLVFERLFGAEDAGLSEEARLRRQHERTSVLDFVQADARRLHARLGGADRRKLDEYLASVRELEVRIARAGDDAEGTPEQGLDKPKGIPSELPEHFRLMNQLLALAFQSDLTRVATFMFANEGSNHRYDLLDINDGHHELSHHGNDAAKQERIQAINTFHVQQLADLLGRLQAVREGEGTLLDSLMLVYGSGIGDGNRHNHNDLPVLLVGKGGGTIQANRHRAYSKDTPLNNLFLALLDRVGAPTAELGDSTGPLAGLDS